jgi:AcrR family transcriptional regulator
MARNAEASKERILEAALAEFAAYGVAGARVDRIAATAECNKNLIYIYFHDKDSLFKTVVMRQVARVAAELPFTADDLSGYATRAFDYAMAHPDQMRLMAWFSLEQGSESGAERRASFNGKVKALLAAQENGTVGRAFPARFMVTAVMALGTAWSAANPFGYVLDPASSRDPARLREAVAAAVRLISNARTLEERHAAVRRTSSRARGKPRARRAEARSNAK